VNDGLKSILKQSVGDSNVFAVIQNLLDENSAQKVI
jgi:hypothetical protein